jgi:hypothetical protein
MAEVTIYVEVDDERELWQAARDHFCADRAPRTVPEDELDEMFGDGKDEEEPYDVSACLRQLADPGVSWPGTTILDSSCEL